MDAEKKLKDYIELHGIKSQFICDKTGITKVAMSNILNGKRKLTANELLLISKAIDLPLNFFTQEVNN
ncbi:MAG: helix-turn-helix transcriptional regulator [Bacilli bacterium]|nr:helix-turn-helix transcriptional regulator [Bacilli bacterium]